MADELVISGIRLHLTDLAFYRNRAVIDRGILPLFTLAGLKKGDRLLVLGDGGAILALVAAKIIGEANVVMAGCTAETADWLRKNAGLNGMHLTVIEGKRLTGLRGQSFSVIIVRPSLRLEFPAARRLIQGAYRHLLLGGRCLFLVHRRFWYKRRLRAVFGQVRVIRVRPYHLLYAEKTSETRPRRLARLLRRKAVPPVGGVIGGQG